MSSLTKCCVISYAILVVAMMGKPCFCSDSKAKVLPSLSQWKVVVGNQLSGGQVLSVHCKSKDDDLGEHAVTVGMTFSWDFKINIWGTTLYWCELRTPTNKHKSFEVFWPEKNHDWLGVRCAYSTCIWVARDDGIYLDNIPARVFEHVHDWET